MIPLRVSSRIPTFVYGSMLRNLIQAPGRVSTVCSSKVPFHTTNPQMANSQSSDWSATQYLKFGYERSRAVHDLLAQIPLQSPKRIIDLGCGPGSSTEALVKHYPQAHLTGMDSSPNMLEKAKVALPNVEFIQGDLTSYIPDEPADLLFSNAVFHWLKDTERFSVMTRLIQSQQSGGVFAFQVPDNFLEPAHVLMRETAAEGPWASTLKGLNSALDPMASPQRIYNELKPICASVNIWHSHYHHVLEDPEAIVEWVKGTGLRPFINPLSRELRDGYLKAYLGRITRAYPRLDDGRVMLRYPRLFVVTVRA